MDGDDADFFQASASCIVLVSRTHGVMMSHICGLCKCVAAMPGDDYFTLHNEFSCIACQDILLVIIHSTHVAHNFLFLLDVLSMSMVSIWHLLIYLPLLDMNFHCRHIYHYFYHM